MCYDLSVMDNEFDAFDSDYSSSDDDEPQELGPNYLDFGNEDITLIREHLAQGGNPNICICVENTYMYSFWYKTYPLLIAANYNRYNVCKLLLNHGADLQAQDDEKCNALMIAVEKENLELCKLFLNKGINVNQTNVRGQSALSIAVSSCNYAITKLLVNAGANVNHQNHLGHTCLFHKHHGTTYSTHIHAMLLEANADINIANDSGNTALITYFKRLCKEKYADLSIKRIVKTCYLYLRYGANINAENVQCESALSWACKLPGGIPLIKFLAYHGANIESFMDRFNSNLLPEHMYRDILYENFVFLNNLALSRLRRTFTKYNLLCAANRASVLEDIKIDEQITALACVNFNKEIWSTIFRFIYL